MEINIDFARLEFDTKYIAKQIKMSMILSPIWEIGLTIAMYYTIYQHSIVFFALVISVMLFYSIIFTISQQKWLNKYSRIITKINFKENSVVLNTTSILWKKSKEIKVANNKLIFKNKNMYWWAKKGRDRTTYIFNIEGKEYYLVSEYYDNINLVIEKFETF